MTAARNYNPLRPDTGVAAIRPVRRYVRSRSSGIVTAELRLPGYARGGRWLKPGPPPPPPDVHHRWALSEAT